MKVREHNVKQAEKSMQILRKNRSFEHGGGFDKHWRRDIEEVYKMQSEKKNLNYSSTIRTTSMSHNNSQISLARSIGPEENMRITDSLDRFNMKISNAWQRS